jgi:DNA modification methylase
LNEAAFDNSGCVKASGGGTTPVVAQQLGRRYIACDISKIAISVTRDRLLRTIDTCFEQFQCMTCFQFSHKE